MLTLASYRQTSYAKSMQRKGFTIIELLIVMVVVGILLTFSVISIMRSLVNARDRERADDIAVIARGLDGRYKNGNSTATAAYITRGSYPSINEILHAQGNSVSDITPTQISGGYLTSLLPGTSVGSFIPPGDTPQFIVSCTAACGPAETPASKTNIETITKIYTYTYEPINTNGDTCITTPCVRYNLYYRTEDGILHTVPSKYQ
jgi:prepilin-type N-terminal cleavage/methylation domain-containing protein